MPTINEDKKALPASPPQSPPKKRKAASKDDLEAQAAKKAKNEQVNKAEFLDAVFDHARKSGTEYLMNRVSLAFSSPALCLQR